MSLITKGGFESVGDYAIQPDRSITEKNDGTLEGIVVMRCDKSKQYALPIIGATHPDDSRLEMYQSGKVYQSNGVVEMTGSFFGLVSSETEPEISYSGGQNNDPIDTHPDFEDFAGTPAAPLNGAKFDAESQEFIGFFSPSAAGQPNFRGVQYYLTPSSLITLSYWTDKVPTLKNRMSVHDSVDGFKKPDDMKDFLLVDTPYRQVGSFYQVTEQYVGSGPNGINRVIYPD